MPPQDSGKRVVRFGSYEVDLQQGVLSKSGIRIKLQEQPFRILTLLLERPGQVVTREEIRRNLWADNTFVEFDDGLNTAIRKLRSALGDTADNPRFVETIPRRGYRFVAPASLPEAMPPSDLPAFEQATPKPEATLPGRASADLSRKERSPYLWMALAVVIVAAAGFGYWYRFVRRPAFQVTAKDTILLADFVNTTGDAVFNDALKQALQVGLEQSPFLQFVSDRKTAMILEQMGRSSEERVNGSVALEVCQRASAKVAVQGEISSLGRTYLIGLAAIRCDTGDPIAHEQLEAAQKEDVVNALGKAISRLRERLGESMPSIHKHDIPLEMATTPSLEALQAYNLALATWDREGDEASIPFFKHALELDPNFAMVYAALGTVYNNLDETEQARANTTRAYELRNRVTETERRSIEARYYLFVTGDLESAAQVYELWVENYPSSAGAMNHLGTTQAELGEYEKAAATLRTALALDPARATTYANLAVDLLSLNKVDEADAVLGEANKHNLHTDYLLEVEYWIAFLRGDSHKMQRILLQSSEITGARPRLLTAQANTEAYYGHLEKSRELSQVAAELLLHDGDKESAAVCLAESALRDAEFGEDGPARKSIAQALKLSHAPDVAVVVTVVKARIGDSVEAEQMAQQLNREYPSSTLIQEYWLPVIKAAIDLQGRHWSKAIEALNTAIPKEMVSVPDVAMCALYPAYIRGEAYLGAGDGTRAATEFQKLLDHSGLMLNSPMTPLAHLDETRAWMQVPDPVKAREAYRHFLQLWNTADPDVSILRSARKDYSRLSTPN